jgi:hypothetical protein
MILGWALGVGEDAEHGSVRVRGIRDAQVREPLDPITDMATGRTGSALRGRVAQWLEGGVVSLVGPAVAALA